MLIKNKEELVKGELKNIKKDFLDCYDEILSNNFFEKSLVFLDKLKKFERIFFIGVGKSSAKFASFLESKINIEAGLVICKDGDYKLKKSEVFYSSHPYVTKKSFEAYQKIIDMKNSYSFTKNDVVVFFVSGGASSLVENLKKNIIKNEYVMFSQELINSGLDINQINIIRKALSKIKAGGILNELFPAKVLGLIESDVLNQNLDVVGSGLTFVDNNDYYGLAKKIIEKHSLKDTLPQSINEFFYKRKNFEKIIYEESNLLSNELVFNNKHVITKIVSFLNEKKYDVEVVSYQISENLENFCDKLVLDFEKYDSRKVFVFGSELVLNIPADKLEFSKGGRNQHFVSYFLNKIKTKRKFVVASFATDGSDFIEGIAGGMVDSETNKDSLADKLSFYRSYDFLDKVDGLVKTKPTGINVCDVILIYVE